MGAILNLFSSQQESEECCSCGVLFTMPAALVAQRRKDKASFYCPNGHAQSYTRSLSDQLREQLEAEKQKVLWAQQARDRAQEAEKKALAREAAAKGAVTKMRNRVGCGMCPVCNRNFTALRRHMETKHPELRHEKCEPAK